MENLLNYYFIMKKRFVTVLLACSLAGGLFAQQPWFKDKDLTLTGAYYYPEHWDESQWERDFKQMHDLGFEFTHFFSGIIFCEIAYIFYKHFLPNEKRKFLMFIFINALNAMIALFWEFYEYALLIFFNYDAINHYSTGIHDSITDMLVAVIGSFILSLYLTHYDQRNDNHFFIKLAKNIKFNKTSHPN